MQGADCRIQDVDLDGEDNWAGHATYKIKDFFTMLEEEFRTLKLVRIGELQQVANGFLIDVCMTGCS